MALLIGSKILESGVVVENCYCKVESLDNLDKQMMIINIIYKVDEKAESTFNPERKSIPYNINGENPFVQAYTHLKGLEDFKDAKDC